MSHVLKLFPAIYVIVSNKKNPIIGRKNEIGETKA